MAWFEMTRRLVIILSWIADLSIRRLVAIGERSRNPDVLSALLAIDHPEIDTAVSMNPHASPETLDRLWRKADALTEADREWKLHIISNPALPENRLIGIMQSRDASDVRIGAACALVDRWENVAAGDPRTVAECRDRLTGWNDSGDYPKVRMALAKLRTQMIEVPQISSTDPP